MTINVKNGVLAQRNIFQFVHRQETNHNYSSPDFVIIIIDRETLTQDSEEKYENKFLTRHDAFDKIQISAPTKINLCYEFALLSESVDIQWLRQSHWLQTLRQRQSFLFIALRDLNNNHIYQIILWRSHGVAATPKFKLCLSSIQLHKNRV